MRRRLVPRDGPKRTQRAGTLYEAVDALLWRAESTIADIDQGRATVEMGRERYREIMESAMNLQAELLASEEDLPHSVEKQRLRLTGVLAKGRRLWGRS